MTITAEQFRQRGVEDANANADKLLRRGLELIEAGWTQHGYARDDDDEYTPTHAAVAVKFCSWGALERTAFELGLGQAERTAAIEAANKRLEAIVHRPIIWFNDDVETTKEDVVLAFKRALVGEDG